jgi:hypothetical protein
MIKQSAICLAAALVSYAALASVKKEEPVVPEYKLQLEEELYFTDKNGVALPEQIIKAKLGNLVRIYKTDGFYYEGKITEIEEDGDVYKVYGDITNIAGARFGFGLAKGGKFAGAVIEREKEITYVLEFDAAYKGFVLRRSYTRDHKTS